MKRREFIAILGGAAAMWSNAARAQQQPTIPVIGFLCSGSSQAFASLVTAFRDGLKEAGYVDGRNVAIEFAWAEGRYDQLPLLATDLVSRHVAVIAAAGGAVAGLAAKAATSTIPIVIASGDDPVKYGLVASLSRPGGNITGVTLFIDILTAKRVELLIELAPAAALAILVNPRNPNAETEAKDAQAAAQKSGRELHVLVAGNEGEIQAAFAKLAISFDSAFSAIEAGRGNALVVLVDPFTRQHRERIVAFAAHRRLPAIYEAREFVEGGGLASYGPSLMAIQRRAAEYIDKIFNGARPADLPVEQPTKFELLFNLRAAKAIGITVPPSLLARAEVIE